MEEGTTLVAMGGPKLSVFAAVFLLSKKQGGPAGPPAPTGLLMTDYMARALALAEMARGSTGNNPAVGAVVVRDGRIVGEGYTQPPGQAHAEVMALRQAGELARGATVFVTLEPCCHYGRTPPCTDALIAAGVAEVHMATLDPNPMVSGGGKAALDAAGGPSGRERRGKSVDRGIGGARQCRARCRRIVPSPLPA